MYLVYIYIFQTLVGSLNWISIYTRPDITLVVEFLLEYNHQTSPSHLKVALYYLWYVHYTYELGIYFT